MEEIQFAHACPAPITHPEGSFPQLNLSSCVGGAEQAELRSVSYILEHARTFRQEREQERNRPVHAGPDQQSTTPSEGRHSWPPASPDRMTFRVRARHIGAGRYPERYPATRTDLLRGRACAAVRCAGTRRWVVQSGQRMQRAGLITLHRRALRTFIARCRCSVS